MVPIVCRPMAPHEVRVVSQKLRGLIASKRMTTRSGRAYTTSSGTIERQTDMDMGENEASSLAGVVELLKVMLEERKRRNKEGRRH